MKVFLLGASPFIRLHMRSQTYPAISRKTENAKMAEFQKVTGCLAQKNVIRARYVGEIGSKRVRQYL